MVAFPVRLWISSSAILNILLAFVQYILALGWWTDKTFSEFQLFSCMQNDEEGKDGANGLNIQKTSGGQW